MLYQYLAKDFSGKLVKGQIEAQDHRRALHLLREKELFVVEIKRVQVQTSFSLFKRRVGPKELSLYCSQLATMVSAGVSITRALAIVAEQTDNKLLKEATSNIIKELENGNSLSDSIKKHGQAFPQIFISLMEAGESGGMLDVILQRLASYFDSEREIREKLKSAMTYPSFIAAFALVALNLMLIFVVPNFINMYGDLGAGDQLPMITKILISFSSFLRSNIFWVIILLLLLVFSFSKLMEIPSVKIRWDYKKTSLPIFGKLLGKTALARFCRTMALMTASNVDIVSSLQLVSKAVENDNFGEEILDALAGIQEGGSLADEFKTSKFIDSLTLQMLKIGEETGSLDEMLEKMGRYHEEDVKYSSERLGSLIEPAMIIVVALMVGLILIAIMLPMFDMMQYI